MLMTTIFATIFYSLSNKSVDVDYKSKYRSFDSAAFRF